MQQKAEIFETHYQDYCRQIAGMDLARIKDILGIEINGSTAMVPFFNQTYQVSGNGILNAQGDRAGYGISVILAKYILRCPDQLYLSREWTSFKDFKQTAHFTNVNYFNSDVEDLITQTFSGNLIGLQSAGQAVGGVDFNEEMPYDLCLRFKALPRVDLLLLFNDRDDDFPAQTKVLFSGHVESYLDPESLAMTGAALAKHLVRESRY